jgi:glycosyltransferase involved in cell wall biosynthesis
LSRPPVTGLEPPTYQPDPQSLRVLADEAASIPTLLKNPGSWPACMSILSRAQLSFDQAGESEKRVLVKRLEGLVSPDFLTQLLLFSFLFQVTKERVYAKRLLPVITESRLPPGIARFLFWQLARIAFLHSNLFTVEEQILVAKYYARLVAEWREHLLIHHPWIPPGQRMGTRVVLTTTQLLGTHHGPSSQVLEICRTLQRDFGKEVFLINTAEIPRFLPLPFYGFFPATFLDRYSAANRFEYREEVFSFRQFGTIESVTEVSDFLATIAAWNPGFVLNIGGGSVVTDLCAEFTTVATLPMIDRLPVSVGTMLFVTGGLTETDRQIQQGLDISAERVILAGTAYELPERSKTLSRSDYRIPKEAYVIAIVGNRLDDEITCGFISDLNRLLERVPEAFLVFAGEWQSHQRLTSENSGFRERTLSLGYQRDLLALYEICDCYLNPPRVGGGTSAAWALAMGLPVYTQAHGDVGAITGEAFPCASIEAMAADLRRSIRDPKYRESQKTLAKKQFAQFTDRTQVVGSMLRQIEDRLSLRI